MENDFDINIEIPNQIKEILYRLNAHSYQAYIVGKCVRELFFEHHALDYDVITNAPAERIIKIFETYNIIIENENLGEVIVQVLGMGVLISPYRAGFAEDGSPVFTEDITEDLMRREFSFNAIAYHPREGFIDPFHGIKCLKKDMGTVAAIGEEMPYVKAEEKFRLPAGEIVSPFISNPVTILKALGYYSSGNYIISNITKESILKYKSNVKLIPKSEIRTELSWVIGGKKVAAVLEEYSEVFIELIPEFTALKGYEQHRVEHSYDALTHTYKSVGFSSPILTLRYAMLFHSLGKPDCFSIDGNGRGHYYGHSERSAIYAERIMTRLGFTEEDIKEVCFIIKNHDADVGADRRSLKMSLKYTSPERLKLLLQCKYADTKAKSPDFEGAAQSYKRLVDAVNEIIAFKECYSIEQLAVKRSDLMQHRIAGSEAHADELLDKLLDAVMETPFLNTWAKLIQIAEKVK